MEGASVDGARVGTSVGYNVVGWEDGETVGPNVGELVGLEVGLAVDNVGSDLTQIGESSEVQSGVDDS